MVHSKFFRKITNCNLIRFQYDDLPFLLSAFSLKKNTVIILIPGISILLRSSYSRRDSSSYFWPWENIWLCCCAISERIGCFYLLNYCLGPAPWSAGKSRKCANDSKKKDPSECTTNDVAQLGIFIIRRWLRECNSWRCWSWCWWCNTYVTEGASEAFKTSGKIDLIEISYLNSEFTKAWMVVIQDYTTMLGF